MRSLTPRLCLTRRAEARRYVRGLLVEQKLDNTVCNAKFHSVVFTCRAEARHYTLSRNSARRFLKCKRRPNYFVAALDLFSRMVNEAEQV